MASIIALKASNRASVFTCICPMVCFSTKFAIYPRRIIKRHLMASFVVFIGTSSMREIVRTFRSSSLTTRVSGAAVCVPSRLSVVVSIAAGGKGNEWFCNRTFGAFALIVVWWWRWGIVSMRAIALGCCGFICSVRPYWSRTLRSGWYGVFSNTQLSACNCRQPKIFYQSGCPKGREMKSVYRQKVIVDLAVVEQEVVIMLDVYAHPVDSASCLSPVFTSFTFAAAVSRSFRGHNPLRVTCPVAETRLHSSIIVAKF